MGTSLIARLKLKSSRKSDLMHGHDVDDDNWKRGLTEAAGENKEDCRDNLRLASPRAPILAIVSVSRGSIYSHSPRETAVTPYLWVNHNTLRFKSHGL